MNLSVVDTYVIFKTEIFGNPQKLKIVHKHVFYFCNLRSETIDSKMAEFLTEIVKETKKKQIQYNKFKQRQIYHTKKNLEKKVYL